MHEFAFAHKIYKIAEETAKKYKAKKITVIYLEIGELTLIIPELLRESFKIATSGTIAEGAELKIEILPGKIKCRACGKISEIQITREAKLTGLQLFQCKYCKSKNTEIIFGKSANVKNIQIQQ